jgi:hypothetical protein
MKSLAAKCVVAVASAAIALVAGSAQAGQAVKFYSLGVGADVPAGRLDVSQFGNDMVGSTNLNNMTGLPVGYSWSGTGTISDTTSSQGAEPAVPPGVYGTGNYLDLQHGQSDTLTLPTGADDYLQVYIGSLDAFNEITFHLQGGSTVVFTGNGAPPAGAFSLGAISGADNGAQTVADTNGLFTFLFSNPISSVTFADDSSSLNAFEISHVYAAPTPEPATWTLLLLGVGVLGGALRFPRNDSGRRLERA